MSHRHIPAKRQRTALRTWPVASRALTILLLASVLFGPLLVGSGQANASPITAVRFQSHAASQPGAPAALTAAYSPKLMRYPYLTDLVGQFVTVNWATDTSGSTGSVKWGPAGSCTANTTVATKISIVVNGITEFQWKAQISPLTPGTQYCYRIFLNATDLLDPDPAPLFWPQVPAGSSEPFTFAVIGETGMVDGSGANPDQERLMSLLAASGARFAISPGEIAHPSGSETNFGDLWQTGANTSAFFGPSFWKKVGASIPFFPAIGNLGMARSDINHPHLIGFPQDKAVALSGGVYAMQVYCDWQGGSVCYNGTIASTYPSAWYAFDAGNARFYILQAAWPNNNVGSGDIYSDDYAYHWSAPDWAAPNPDKSKWSPEYRWLYDDLAAHPAQLKFAVMQFPAYSDNDNQPSDTYLQGAGSVEGLLSRNGVSIIFAAQSQNYQRWLQPNGGVYSYVTGGGGATPGPLRLCSPNDAYGIGWSDLNGTGYGCKAAKPTREQVFHFLLVHVNGTSAIVTPINSLGQTFDPVVYHFPGGVTSLARSLYLPLMTR